MKKRHLLIGLLLMIFDELTKYHDSKRKDNQDRP